MSRRLALLATAVVACGGHAPEPAPIGRGSAGLAPAREDAGVEAVVADASPPAPMRPLDQDLPRLALRAIQQLRAVGSALDAADCPAATAKLADVPRAYADVIAATAAIARADRKAELAAAFAPQQAALDAAGTAVVHARTMSACVADPQFASALDRALGAP